MRVQGQNCHPLSVVWKNGDTTTVIRVSKVLELFNPNDTYPLLKRYKGRTLYEILIKTAPKKLMKEKVRGVTKKIKQRLLKDLHRMWWERNKINFSHE